MHRIPKRFRVTKKESGEWVAKIIPESILPFWRKEMFERFMEEVKKIWQEEITKKEITSKK
jgi:hypothetical protein